jgi:hypothetical protein
MTVRMSENQSCRIQVLVTVFRGLRLKWQKVGLNMRLNAFTARGGGAGCHPIPSHMIQKRTGNATLSIRPIRCTARNLQHFSHDCSTLNIHTHYYF